MFCECLPAKHHKTQNTFTLCLHLLTKQPTFANKPTLALALLSSANKRLVMCDYALCQAPRQSLPYLRLRLYYTQPVHICAFRFRSTFHTVRLWGDCYPLPLPTHCAIRTRTRTRAHTHTQREILTSAQYKLNNPHISLSFILVVVVSVSNHPTTRV